LGQTGGHLAQFEHAVADVAILGQMGGGHEGTQRISVDVTALEPVKFEMKGGEVVNNRYSK
jgi:hypothetical protein